MQYNATHFRIYKKSFDKKNIELEYCDTNVVFYDNIICY